MSEKMIQNEQKKASKFPKDLEVFSCPFLQESNFRNKQSMVQYPRSYENGCWIIEQNTNHTQVSQTYISKTNLIFFYGRCKAIHRANFLQVRPRTVASFQNPDLTNKSWEVHLYCTLMACGDGSCTPSNRYVKILEFRHFERFFRFDQSDRKTYKKAISDGVNVSVVLDSVCGNTSKRKQIVQCQPRKHEQYHIIIQLRILILPLPMVTAL